MRTLAPKTLTREEVEALLQASASNPRDSIIFRIALGTALRLGEIVSLDVGDFYQGGKICSRTQVRVKGGRMEDVFISGRLQKSLADFISWKRDVRESLEPDAPLFISKRGQRISPRRVQQMFRQWQGRAGFQRFFRFHHLRHTSITLFHDSNGDLLATQRFARHAAISTTMIYAHPSDERLRQQVENLPC